MKFEILFGTFVTCILIANLIAGKIVGFWGFFVPVAVICYPITFLITDTISEVWGKGRARKVIWAGFFCNIVMVVLITLAIWIPPAPFYELQEAFQSIFGLTWRVVLASMVAYLVSQHHDIFAFHFLKKKTNGRFLWLRNNLSTIVSQGIDTVLFITIAFYGIFPIVPMIISQYIIKLAIAFGDTPFCYLLVRWCRG